METRIPIPGGQHLYGVVRWRWEVDEDQLSLTPTTRNIFRIRAERRQKMMDYTVIGARTVDQLIKEVRVYCSEGWVPHGTPVIDPTVGVNDTYLQAMTREEE